MIEFQHVSKIYKGGKVAVEDVNLSFEKGEFICFIGTSGSGKTTSMRMINRMTEPTKGKILIDGQDIQKFIFSIYVDEFGLNEMGAAIKHVLIEDFTKLSLTKIESLALISYLQREQCTQ